MHKKTIKIANALCLENEYKIKCSGLIQDVKEWFQKRKIKDKEIPTKAKSLNKYLYDSNKIDLVKIPEDYKTGKITHAKIEIIIKALLDLKNQLEDMPTSPRDKKHKQLISQINSVISDLEKLEILISKKEQKEIAKNIALMLFGNPKTASTKMSFEDGVTEELEEDDEEQDDFAYELEG